MIQNACVCIMNMSNLSVQKMFYGILLICYFAIPSELLDVGFLEIDDIEDDAEDETYISPTLTTITTHPTDPTNFPTETSNSEGGNSNDQDLKPIIISTCVIIFIIFAALIVFIVFRRKRPIEESIMESDPNWDNPMQYTVDSKLIDAPILSVGP